MAGIAAPGELRDTTATEFAVAQPGDDVELRALLRRSVIPGSVRVAFTREPDYFAGEGLAGNEDTTLVARRDGRLVAMGRCSVNTLYRNGDSKRIAYLGELRVDPGTPGSAGILREGYEFLAHTRPTADGFFTSIASDNHRARRVLERGARFGLPAYEKLCDLVTLVAPVRRTSAVESALEKREELVEFLRREASRSHLGMTWSPDQWRDLARHETNPGSFTVVRRDGQVVGAAAIWDQRSFRQTTIDGYEGSLSVLRPLLNSVRTLHRGGALPTPGSVLAQGMLFGAYVSAPDDWPALWRAVQSRASALDLSWVTVARDARDQELPVLRRLLRAREYHTTLYGVVWRDGPHWSDAWDARPFRPEVALL